MTEPDFRIWMSCEPREGFPLGLLQKAVKVTNEPPKGIKAGMNRTFSTLVNSEFLEKSQDTILRQEGPYWVNKDEEHFYGSPG